MALKISVLNGPDKLEAFVQKCEKALFSVEPTPFVFPEGCSSKKWLVKEIKEKNKNILSALKNNANVYAILSRERGSKWQRNYVGQRKSEGIRERIIQHLITKDHRTGSVLNKVKEVVSLNNEVGLSFIKVEPDSLRLFVEEVIIANNKQQLRWNIHG